MPNTHILISHPTRIFCEGLAMALTRMKAGEISVDASYDALTLVEGAGRLKATDIVVIDFDYPDRTGLATVRRLRAAGVAARTLMIGIPNVEAEIISAIQSGAAGYETQDASLDDLIANIEALAIGQTICSPSVASRLFSSVAESCAPKHPRPTPPAPHLTPRETEIVALIEEGLSNKEIARNLEISTQTVKNHVHNVLEKLHLHRRSEAARYARQRGLIGTGTSTKA